MMKTILLAVALFSATFGFSQTTATQFTVNDCAGTSHNLFNELDAGKVIVICWVMPCSSCTGPAMTAFNVVNSYATSHPNRVYFYLVDDYADMQCSSLNSWASSNSMSGATSFSDAAISMSNYGSAGMPKTVVLGGTDHKVFFNQNNSAAGNSTALQSAIVSALGTTGIGNTNKVSIQPEIFPNPSTAITSISYSSKTDSETSVFIYNLLGEKVKTVFKGKQGTGNHKVSFDASDLQTGLYFVRIISANDEQTIKFTVSH